LTNYLISSYSLIIDRILSTLLVFIIGVFLARYYSLEDVGQYAFFLALFGFGNLFLHLGLAGIVTKKILDNEKNILGTVYFIKLYVSIFIFFIYAFFLWFTNSFDLKIVLFSALIFLPLQVTESWYQAKVFGYILARVNIIVSLFGFIGKTILIFNEYDLVYILAIHGMQLIIQSLLMYFVYANQRTHKIRWRFNKNLASKTLKDSWPIYLGTIFAFIYLKIDILMLKAISGLSEVGYYSIAAQLSEGWYFIPAILTSTYMPKLHNSKSFNDTSYYFQISTLSSYFVLLSYSVVLFTLLFSDSLVVFIYGEKFAATSLILQIHIFAGIFFTLRNIFSKWLILEELYYLSLWSQLLGALSNVILNLLLIPIYGGIGAAIATLVSYMFASYFILLFFRKTRKLFWIFTKSLFLIPLFKKI